MSAPEPKTRTLNAMHASRILRQPKGTFGFMVIQRGKGAKSLKRLCHILGKRYHHGMRWTHILKSGKASYQISKPNLP